MRIWLHTSTKSAALSPSAAVSVVAHAMLIGGAVYGTGKASSAIQQEIAERIYYLPPPDRTPAAPARVEQVRYVEPGAGVDRAPRQALGETLAGSARDRRLSRSRQAGIDESTQAAQLAAPPSADSVYSVVTADEAAQRDETSAAPVYPPDLLAQKIEGSVVARFVLDSMGRSEANSVLILSTTDPGFAVSVREVIPRMHFRPAMVGGRPVRQVVEQGFQFRIVPPVPTTVAEHTRATPAQ